MIKKQEYTELFSRKTQGMLSIGLLMFGAILTYLFIDGDAHWRHLQTMNHDIKENNDLMAQNIDTINLSKKTYFMYGQIVVEDQDTLKNIISIVIDEGKRLNASKEDFKNKSKDIADWRKATDFYKDKINSLVDTAKNIYSKQRIFETNIVSKVIALRKVIQLEDSLERTYNLDLSKCP